MSELDIRIRKLQDNGSTFRATPDTLYMGGIGSAKVDRLRFEIPEEWEHCAITLHVQRLSGTRPDPQLLDEQHCAVVDRRWTLEKQGIWMLMAVDDSGYIAMTKPGQYTCYETIDLSSVTETVTQSIYEQFVAAVLQNRLAAQEAAKQAESSANTAVERAKQAESSADAAAVSEENAQKSQQAAADSAGQAEQSAKRADEIIDRMNDIKDGYCTAYDLTIPETAWKAKKSDRPAGYPLEAEIADPVVNPELEPHATVGQNSWKVAINAGLAWICETGEKQLTFWAKIKPTADIDLHMVLFGKSTTLPEPPTTSVTAILGRAVLGQMTLGRS